MSTGFDYISMVEDALRKGVVQKALEMVRDDGLHGDHHFYISFDTTHPEVHIPDSLRERFPQEMTIVVQHQFWDLQVEDEYFSVMLSFSNLPHRLVVPYAALTAFADPSVKFALQFTPRKAAAKPASKAKSTAAGKTPLKSKATLSKAESSKASSQEEVTAEAGVENQGAEGETANIISFDRFRK
jgi:hypothetical protein